MSVKDTTLREKYRNGEIFSLDTLVSDNTNTYKIVSRGSNYLTLESESGETCKKWLHEVFPIDTPKTHVDESEFSVVNGQIKMFGYESKNLDESVSTFIVEQFNEFSDTYSKHQIVKLLDIALQESDLSVQYEMLDKVCDFYDKHDFDEPFIVEAVKNEIERKRIAEIIANVADIPVGTSPFNTISAAIEELKKKYKTKMQWEVIAPIFKLAQEYGISGISAKMPFNLGSTVLSEDVELDAFFDVCEEHLDLLLEDIDDSDVETIMLEPINEVLTIQGRTKLRMDMKRHGAKLESKRKRALAMPANTEVLSERARRLAIQILKRRMFKKAPGDLSRQEKERFEAGASKRAALIARLSQKLVAKVREIQRTRLHSHTLHNGHHQVDKALKDISGSA